MQLELFLFVDFHASHTMANNFVGAFNVIITPREFDVFHGKIGFADHLVFVGPNEHHWSVIGVSSDGVQPKFDEADGVRFVALAVFVAS